MTRLIIAFSATLLATASSLWCAVLPAPSASVELPEDVTTVFAYDNDTFGVLSPSSATITVISADGMIKGEVQLRGPLASMAGPIYPDQILRSSDGRIYWLRKSTGTIIVLTPSGALERSIPVNLPAPFWFSVEKDGNITVFGSSDFGPVAAYEYISADQKLRSTRVGWLTPMKQYNSFADTFFFGQGPRVELLAHFPYVRFADGTIIDYAQCDAFSGDTARYVSGQQTRLPLTQRFRPPFAPEFTEFPVILGATAGPDRTIFAVANGSVLLRIDPDHSWHCWSVPAPRGRKLYHLTSVAVAGLKLGILTGLAGKGKILRIWDLRAARLINNKEQGR